jgi:CelD/BcsL family acetyltransferase involved in cellulose biosynthesis
MTDLTSSTVRGLDAFRGLGAELDDLHARVGAPVSTRSLWLIPWAETHPEFEPVCVVVRSPARVEAAAVLARRRVMGCDMVVAAAHTLSDRIWLAAVDDASARALADAIAAFLGSITRPWFLDVRQLPVGDPVGAHLARLLPTSELRAGVPLPQTHFTDGQPIKEYVRKKHRQNAGAAERRLSCDHEWTYGWLRDPAEIERLLPEIEAIRQVRDDDLGRFSDLDRGGGEFWRRLVRAAAGTVEVATLTVDGRLGAYCVCLRDGDVMVAWDARPAPEYLSYWTGNLVLTQVLMTCHADPSIRSVDWCRGESFNKQRLANGIDEAQDLRAWSSPAARRTYELLAVTRAKLAAYKNNTDGLHHLWMSLRKRVDRLSASRRALTAPGDARDGHPARVPDGRGASGEPPERGIPGQQLEPEDTE